MKDFARRAKFTTKVKIMKKERQEQSDQFDGDRYYRFDPLDYKYKLANLRHRQRMAMLDQIWDRLGNPVGLIMIGGILVALASIVIIVAGFMSWR
jgi:hypothetical protein